MLVAKSDELDHIFTGPEIGPQVQDNGHAVFDDELKCPICGSSVTYRDVSLDRPFEYFTHVDGRSDCFETESTSDEHRLAMEVTVKVLHNRISEVTGEPVKIDVERWIGIPDRFVIADVRITSPLRVAAEIFYKADSLALGRRFKTMFENGYRAYLIFHREGKYCADEIERYIQRVAPLRVGRFDPETLEMTEGDLFSKQHISLIQSNRARFPDFIALSR